MPTKGGGGGGGGGAGGVPGIVCYLEANDCPVGNGNLVWDTLYDEDGNIIPNLPAGLGLALTVGDTRLDAIEDGLFLLSMIMQLNLDDTAKVQGNLNMASPATFEDREVIMDVSAAAWNPLITVPLLRFSGVFPMKVSSGDNIQNYVTAFNPTDPNYKPVNFAVLKVVRIK